VAASVYPLSVVAIKGNLLLLKAAMISSAFAGEKNWRGVGKLVL